MAAAAAKKMRRHRARRRAGRIVLSVEVDEVGSVEFLIAARLLSPGVEHGRAAIEEATEKFLKMMIEGEVSR